MADNTADLSLLFETSEFEPETVDRLADAIYETARSRSRFQELTEDYRRKTEGGESDALRLAMALYLLCRFSDALDQFGAAGKSKYRHYYAARSALAIDRFEESLTEFEKAASAGWDALECDMFAAQVHIRRDATDAADKLVKKHEKDGQQRVEWHFVQALLAQHADARTRALELYEQALAIEPDHEQSMFRAAWLYDLQGEDERAIELYKKVAEKPRAHVNALINLAVIYEDNGRYDDAATCLQRVLSIYPNHTRARLFYKDVQSSRTMIIDEGLEKRAETRSRLLETPISEFELSVRARNCLKKMRIHTLGDLLKLTEAELMSYKNFGETSLNEIKALLNKRGLHLGQRPDEIDIAALAEGLHQPQQRQVAAPPGAESILGKPVSELELSVRARRCLQRLNIVTVGDLIQHTESDLLSTRNFGQTSLAEIKARLTELGLQLAPKQ